MQTLRLANEEQTVEVDLLAGPVYLINGLNMTTAGMAGEYTYEPFGAQFTFGNYQPVTDSFDIVIQGPGMTVLRTLYKLQNFLESIRLFHAGDIAAQSCWLEWIANKESPKRTMLYSGVFKVTSNSNITPDLAECTVFGKLTVTHHPLWETIAETSITVGPLSTLGGRTAITNVTGNTLARIDTTEIVGGAGTTLYRHWIGIRTYNQGTALFHPLWELEDGFAAGADPGAVMADVTASPYGAGNTKIRVSFAGTTALSARWQIRVADVCAAAGDTAYAQQQGRYLVLCRCKLSGAGAVGIQMRWGYYGWQTQAEEVYIDNTNWRLIPLGNISIPPWEGARHRGPEFMQYFNIALFAERLAGAIFLDLDCLVLIPNEHMLTLSNTNTAPTRYSYAYTYEDDKESAHDLIPAIPYVFDSVESGMTDWYLPKTSSILVAAAENQTVHDPAETVTIKLTYNPRWLLYRLDDIAAAAVI